MDRPEGSAAVVGAATSNPALFTGDVPGRYLVMLSRDGNVTDPSTNCMVRVFEVSLTSDGSAIPNYYPFPATGERDHHSEGISGQGNSGRGYAPVFNEFRDAMVDRVASVQAGVPTGAAQTLPSTATTVSSARAVATATPAINPSTYLKVVAHTVPNGTIVGETKWLDRSATDRGRVRFVDAAGRTVLWANRPGATLAQWDGTTWRPMGAQRIHKVFRPEEFADPAYPNVGIGADAEADTRALERLRNAVHDGSVDYDPTTQPSFELTATVELAAPLYLLKRPIDWYGTDYSAVSIRGTNGPGWSPGRNATTLRWAGAPAVAMTPSTLTFNRAARTIVRATGSFLTDGFGTALTAAQADGRELWIHVDKEGGINRRMHRVQSVTASTITVKAPLNNPVVGFDTSAMLPSDEVSATGYSILEANPFFRLAGVSGYEIEDLVFQGRSSGTGLGQVSSFIHVDIEPDVEERSNASNNRIRRILGFGLLDHVSAAALRIGRPGSVPAVGSQCDTVYADDIYTLGNLGTAGHLSRGVVFEDGNNTKSLWITNSAFAYHSYGIDHYYASEVLGVSNCRFESCWIANVRNAGVLNISSCQSERSGSAIRGLTGTTNMHGCSWNTANTDGLQVEQRVLNADGSNFINYGVYLEVLAVDPVTDTLTIGKRGELNPANGQMVVLRHMTKGEAGLPGNTSGAELYWLDSVTAIGGSSYTCRLYRTDPPGSGGTLVNMTTAGDAGQWLLQPSIFRTSAHDRAAADSSSIALRGCVIWAAEKAPHVAIGSGVKDGLNPTNVQYYNMFPRASWTGCEGRSHSRRVILPDAQTVPAGDYSLTPELSYPSYGTDGEILYSGKPASGYSAIRFDFSRLKINASTIQRIYLPYRTGIKRVRTEVVPDSNGVVGFAGPGLTALTVQVGIYDMASGTTPDPDNLLTAHSIHTAALVNVRDRRWGFASSHYGVDLPAGTEGWWQYNTGLDRGWEAPYTAIDVLFTPTGGSLGGLTAGCVIVYLHLERVPKWERA